LAVGGSDQGLYGDIGLGRYLIPGDVFEGNEDEVECAGEGGLDVGDLNPIAS
jgi:hypothetical protein